MKSARFIAYHCLLKQTDFVNKVIVECCVDRDVRLGVGAVLISEFTVIARNYFDIKFEGQSSSSSGLPKDQKRGSAGL
jgi:hypothetical protein